MVANNKQQEEFIINDIEMEINPSEIQVMDDNWVMEESYLRSKAVFCYRSKYSATKVVLNIPFSISYLTEEDKVNLNNTYNCIKLISELNAYPFCFIKNKRIKAYISPTTMSNTDYMMFAVDEIAVVQDSKASNMVFLEIVLQYYNHVPLIRDFEFRSNLSVGLNTNNQLVTEIGPNIVNSLRDSEVWKQYMNPRVKTVLENLTESGLLDYTNTDNKSIHPMMGVKILAPTMSVISEGIENVDDGRYVGKGTKVITVTDTSSYDNGTFENLIATLSNQNFGFDGEEFKNTEKVQTINSENRIKQGEKVPSKDKESITFKNSEVVNPFLEVAQEYKDSVAQSNKNKEALDKTISKGSKDVFIDWIGHDIQALALGVQKIEVRKKNRIVTHQIGAYKHPIVQYMGKYPLSVNVTIASTNFEIYQNGDYEPPVNVFIKQVLNILDYNRAAIPEAEAYNYLKIQSLATFLFDCESFLPSQSLVSSSASTQGLEQIVYSFNEGDLTEFIEQGKTEASGRNSIDKGQSQITDIINQWLVGMPPALNQIVNNSKSEENITNSHILTVYKAIIELVKEAMNELTMTGYPQYEAITTAIDYSGDLKPNNNVTRTVSKVNTEYTKELEKFKLYKKLAVKQDTNVGLARPQDYQKIIAEQNKSYTQEKQDNGVEVTTLQLHNALIPFMVFILKTRSTLVSGGSTNLPSVSFNPSGRFQNLALSIISKINSGIKEGAIVNEKQLNTEEVKEVLSKVTEQYAKVFFGYNIEDLDFQILSPIAYNRETDLLIPKVDPFFFLKETLILDENEFESIYDKMYKNSNYNENLIKTMDETPNDEKGIADTTMTNLGVTYRKLQEIDYIPLETQALENSGTVGFHNQWGSIMSGGANRSEAGAKKIDPNITNSIERALKKYGKDTDTGFRQYVYAVLYKESGNGTKLTSGTGAVGLFQFTSDAVQDLLQYKNTKLEYSSGAKVGYYKPPASSSIVASVKAASRTDHYLNAQMFIEKYLKEQYSGTQKGGKTDPVYSFIQHNIGRGGLEDVIAVLDRGEVKIKDQTRLNIERQNKKFIGSNDVQTVRNYYNHMASKLSIDNVPDHVNIGAKESIKNTVDKLLDNLSNKNKELVGNKKPPETPLVYQQKYIEQANKNYKEATKSPSDKNNNTPIGTKTMTGVVLNVKDGDTISFKDTSTGKTHNVRLYGLDATEVEKGKNEGEILGETSKKALNQLLKNKTVTVQPNGKDKYGREISIVKLKDGTNVSLTMLRNGYGFLAEDFTTIGEYAKAQEEAKKAQKGLWSYPDGTVTKPRSQNRVDLSPLTKQDLQNVKNNVNYQKFSESDLAYAKKAGKNSLNRYQPFAGGKSFTVTSPYGMRLHPEKKVWKMHTGVDLGSPSGTTVVAASGGTVIFASVKSGYGGTIMIDHGNGFVTLYAHLKQLLVQNGSKVTSQQAIAKSGGARGDANRGTSTGAHLHYEVRYNGSHINPFGTKELTLYKPGEVPGEMINTTSSVRTMTDEKPELEMTRKGVTEENTVYNEDALASAIFKNIYKNTNLGLKASLPAIKVYMTVGNENDKFWLDTLKGDVLYYEIKGIKSFHMNCNNDGNPVDTVIMSIADPSFLNTDGFAGLSKMPGVNVNAIGTDKEIQFKNNRIQLKTGNKLHIRLGYRKLTK